MKFEEMMVELRAGRQVVNEDWNGNKISGRSLYLKLQKPDENSLNTEPYVMMYSGKFDTGPVENGGWHFKRFPWTPSHLDLMSENWKVRKPEGDEK